MIFKSLILTCVAALSVARGMAAEQGPSLLANGDFKLDSKHAGWPEGWARAEGVTWEKDGETHFLRFKPTKPDQMILINRQLVIPTPRPPGLELRVRVRSNDIKPGEKIWFDGRVMTQFKDQTGRILKPQPGAPNFKGTSKGWVDKSVFFKIPEKATLLEIMPCLFRVSQGTLDIAKCEVFPAKEDQLPKPPPMIASEIIVPGNAASLPAPLHVVGNQVQTLAGKSVWLQGLCLDSLQWSAGGDKLMQSVPVAIKQWKANIIRLPVKENFWFGVGPWQKKGEGGLTYRKLVDEVIDSCVRSGAYVALDLHQFGAPTEMQVTFWKDAATRYKNHPGVLFELFNEPHDLSWKVWRNGGNLHDLDNQSTDVGVKENNQEMSDDQTPGMQALLDAVRSTGAKNVVIAGGLDWGYDLSGVMNGFALEERPGGNGIIYSSHIYPWKKDWQTKMLVAAEKYPIFIGEVGCPEKWEDFKFIPENQRYETLGPNCPWPSDMLGLIQKYKLNWTGFSFHPKCGPPVILDWDYTPTPYWGKFVKEALAGKQFELKKMR